MKNILVLAVAFLFVGCNHVDHHSHLGCQESEIVNGECVISEDKNIDLFTTLDQIEVQTDIVEYYEGVSGFLAQPVDPGTYPGVVMIHEWWGLNENVKDMARLLAAEGYVVLAVDVYNGAVAEDTETARRLVTAARENTEITVANMQGATEYLRTLATVDSQNIGSMGWCFGGQQSLNLALNSEDLGATVIYYGNLETEAAILESIDWPVLGIFGAEDQSIPVADVAAFEATLNQLEIENEIYIYPAVGHAFANPSGSRYAPIETLDAWDKTVGFLNKSLKKRLDQ